VLFIFQDVKANYYHRGTSTHPGIIFLTMQELFDKIRDKQDEKVIDISLSYLEIYNETIRDLLVPGGSKQGLMLREDANQAVSVAHLSSHSPKTVSDGGLESIRHS
jgi:kinesin family protein 18/19